MSIQTVYARKCDQCSEGMDYGYVINDGEEHYCSDECLHQKYTVDEWAEMSDGDDTESYWTEWDDPTDIQYILIDNELKELQ